MITKNIDGITMSFFENLSKYKEIKHFVTTRVGESGNPVRKAFNLSFNAGASPHTVVGNRRLLSAALKIPFGGITTAKQVHGHHVRVVGKPMKGKGAGSHDGAMDATDAMVTNIAGICPMILVADCVPILLYDPTKKAVGVVHAGWKGTIGLIAKKTVEAFQEHFDSTPNDMVAGIGPSIGPCCLQVGPEVVVRVEDTLGNQAGYVDNRSADGSGHFDLWKANQEQLLQSGLREENVEVARVCTCCDASHLYFSHRGEKGKAGRFGAGILLL
jgi:YfiH family protein